MKPKHDKLLSNFAFKFNLRHYTVVYDGEVDAHEVGRATGDTRFNPPPFESALAFCSRN